MPEISWFLGIIIRMTIRDHAPAHFHAVYGEYEITVDIETGIVTGKFPRRALMAVLEWYLLHKEELMNNWQAAVNKKPLSKIQPFRTFKIEGHTLSWNNGADFAPEFLKELAVKNCL